MSDWMLTLRRVKVMFIKGMDKPFRYNYHKATRQRLEKINKQIENYEQQYGFKPPKYLHFIKEMLEIGLGVKLYLGGKRGVSKYVFIENKDHLIKVRFSNHRPIKEYEEKEDCDYYVGVSHKQTSTTEQIAYLIKSTLKLN